MGKHRERTGIFVNIVIFLIGIIISIVVTAMLISGTFNIHKFYDVGKICDVATSTMKFVGNSGLRYNYSIGRLDILEDVAQKRITISEKKETAWNYVILELSNMDSEKLECQIEYYNSEGGVVWQQETALVSGENVIFSEDIKYSAIAMNFINKKNDGFSLDKVQFREQESPFVLSKALVCFFFILILYDIFVVVIKYIMRKKNVNISINIILNTLTDGLQRFYRKVGSLGEGMVGKWGNNVKRIGRILCILFLLFYMQIMSYNSLYIAEKYFKYHMYVCAIIIVLFAFLCWEKPLQLLDWDNHFVKIWLVFWLMAAISEFIVPKRYSYQSIMMLFFMGFLYFMWNNMNDVEEVLCNFRKALEIWFWINIPYCYLFCPYTGVRYMGASKNPNIWAMYLVFVLAALLSELELEKENLTGKKRKKVILYFISVGIVWDFIIKTGSSSGMIPAVITQGIYCFRQIQKLKYIAKGKYRLRSIMYLLMGLLVLSGAMKASDWSVREISYKMHITEEPETEIVSRDVGWGVLVAEASAAEKIKNNRVYQKIFYSSSLEDFTSGRNWFWLAYLREANLFGHEFAPELWGKRVSAHSGVLAIMYRYGIFIVIPYVMMIGYYLYYSLKYRTRVKKRTNVMSFVVSSALSVCILLLMENVEFPFYYISWYSLYLLMGVYFGNRPKRV